MDKKDYVDTAFQDFGRIVIYEFADGTHEKLLKSLRRFADILNELPQRDTRALWLFDKVAEGPRLGMLYCLLGEDEEPDPDEELVTKKLRVSTKNYGGELFAVTCTCETESTDGSIDKLFAMAISEISKLRVRKLEEISFSKIAIEDFMEEAVLKFYMRLNY